MIRHAKGDPCPKTGSKTTSRTAFTRVLRPYLAALSAIETRNRTVGRSRSRHA